MHLFNKMCGFSFANTNHEDVIKKESEKDKI
jgi:hypothetical protein